MEQSDISGTARRWAKSLRQGRKVMQGKGEKGERMKTHKECQRVKCGLEGVTVMRLKNATKDKKEGRSASPGNEAE